MLENNNTIILGIDFGSSNSCVSYYIQGQLETLGQNSLHKSIPSIVSISPTGSVFVGSEAKIYQSNQDYFFNSNLKRELLQKNELIFQGKKLNIQILISQIFLHLKREVQLKLNNTVSKCVLTVPAYFSEETRHVLKDSAIIAGLDPIRIINEPTAAAIYYSHKLNTVNKICLFVDAGGLTLDMTVCNILEGVIDVLATQGDDSCGHYLINKEIQKELIDQISRKTNFKDLKELKKQITDLAEQIKTTILDLPIENITLSRKLRYKGLEQIFEFEFDRKMFIKFHQGYLLRFRKVYHTLINNPEIKNFTIEKLILIGGPMNSSLFRTLVLDELEYEVMEYFDNITSVSKGAALYGAFLNGFFKGKILTDVLPISIGVETSNGVFEKLIPSNCKLPCIKTSNFTTTEDFQSKVKIKILEGERPLAKNCNLLGQIVLDNIELGLRGTPVISVILEVSQDGTINAYVEDSKTKDNKNLQINSSSRLKPEQMERLIIEAKKYQRQDAKFISLMSLFAKIRRLKDIIDELFKKKIVEQCLNTKYYELNSKVTYVLKYQYKNYNLLKETYKELIDFYNLLKVDDMDDFQIMKKE